ncbi:unnamed protein product [Acanthoscelides obtectus]|uniref:Dendritic cell-specific transmembrane protein-like domain-containing protein n=1 Tax=Acanthoscelides obtectus TaxID=200917 RepID=A0A9P0PIL9_ACAOB|nr:unnamed protein product [Acanthoscelides obtectus]CAK1626265.1 DC-STAMP domain-containing protein 2 [Acanthoscelides obtectus]
MAYLRLFFTGLKLRGLEKIAIEEKKDALQIHRKNTTGTRFRFRHCPAYVQQKCLKLNSKLLQTCGLRKFWFKLRYNGSCENYVLKSIVGVFCGFFLTYIFFLFSVFQLNFSITTATIFCMVLGCILIIGLAFSSRVRCITLLTVPQFFSEKGRQALLAYAFMLTLTGPARNIANNMGILSESLACGQEQLKAAVRQIIDAVKKPFLAIRDAIKTIIKTAKEIIKKIKELLLKIKRIIMAIVRVIKAAFEFLAKIINLCNKELGTPFERCARVFEDAIADCNAKMGPMFSWLCSIVYIVKSVCYVVKVFDLVCMVVDFISNSIIGVVIRKVKIFVRHIKVMFYIRIRFSHSYKYQMNASKTMSDVSRDIMAEVKHRTETFRAIVKFLTSAAALFFMFIVFKVVYYRYRFLTSDAFDNKYITKQFREIDMARARLGKETVLPLSNREKQDYVRIGSSRLIKTERKHLAKVMTTLLKATLKLSLYMAADYCLFYILDLIRFHGRFQSKVKAPNMPTAHIAGEGLIARLLRAIVKAFQPLGLELEIDTVPCLPTPIPPDYDRYIQIATTLLLCWVLTILQPYGLRLRFVVMCYYHPLRAKQKAIWLYNHMIRRRNTFLKFIRRQLKRKFFGSKDVEKVTCKEYLAANFKYLAVCLGEKQQACVVCGTVFRESDTKKPIRCATPGCAGLYCEECYVNMKNLCTVCLSPIDYGDISDINEEQDSSEDSTQPVVKKKRIKRRARNCLRRWCSCCPCFSIADEEDGDIKVSKKKSYIWRWLGTRKNSKKKCKICKCFKRDTPNTSDDDSDMLLKRKPDLDDRDVEDQKIHGNDSDYYSSSEPTTDYSYSYQYERRSDIVSQDNQSARLPFKDLEKQEIPDYVKIDDIELTDGDAEEHKTSEVENGKTVSLPSYRSIAEFGVDSSGKSQGMKKMQPLEEGPLYKVASTNFPDVVSDGIERIPVTDPLGRSIGTRISEDALEDIPLNEVPTRSVGTRISGKSFQRARQGRLVSFRSLWRQSSISKESEPLISPTCLCESSSDDEF